MVKKSKLLVINVCTFILFLVQIITGGWIWIDFTTGVQTSPDLIRIHPFNGIVLTVFIIFHLYMNRNWIKLQLLNKKV
jgi:cytochrome b subunit of formate dehydrogenase